MAEDGRTDRRTDRELLGGYLIPSHGESGNPFTRNLTTLFPLVGWRFYSLLYNFSGSSGSPLHPYGFACCSGGFKPLVITKLAEFWDYSCVPPHTLQLLSGSCVQVVQLFVALLMLPAIQAGLVPGLATVATIPTDQRDPMHH